MEKRLTVTQAGNKQEKFKTSPVPENKEVLKTKKGGGRKLKGARREIQDEEKRLQ